MVFPAEVTVMVPRAVLAPTASENVTAPVPATKVRLRAVPAAEFKAPSVMAPLVVVSVTPAADVVRTVLPFRVRSPAAKVMFALS